MIGKLFGAWLGGKVAGRNRGTRGALLGYGAAALARRSVPALAVVAGGTWLAKKAYERRNRRSPAYPSDSSPVSSD
jgi:hypothetical protein